MKVRNGFVSNSSSSSFIITGKELADIITNDLKFTDFDQVIDDNVINNLRSKYGIDGTEDLYITRFIPDNSDLWCDIDDYAICYCEGSHIGPYNEDEYVCINKEKEVYIRKVDFE